MSSPTYELRAYRPGDEESILRCVNAVFGQTNPDHVERDLAIWRWSFMENPAGYRIWVATCEDEVVGHYASVPYLVNAHGGQVTFSQIVDSCVHPDHRRGLKRPGLFVELGRAFVDATQAQYHDKVNFGWPVEEAWRIGERYFRYEVVRTQELIGWVPDAGENELPQGVEEIERFDQQARWLYDRCAGEWGASIIRDAAYLNWRYVDHPRFDYKIVGVRDDEGILRGAFVYRTGDWVLEHMGFLMEWLVPPSEPEVGELLHRALRAQLRRDEVCLGGAVFPAWSHWFRAFQDWGWLVYPTEYVTVAIQQHPDYDMYFLRDNWWYQLGDTDLA